ncbi:MULTISPECIES: ABC transporter ATP-binding protein [Inquilinus]|jgi:ABC-type sugar transport system ATPase subunit|uniref:ABC-type sugar transport system ATPase subunit n=1 Tax=Inquilinus ginsengisoli TaxID=363840 RepID=A0ABU1JHY3_9PROT|nr:ABC transporter ATP-binding protein [Inquilinus ginsengisoli]MDR6288215.1 ABC-type sugar transport system ATPase subunit [Inquilinus ginsengisoli]
MTSINIRAVSKSYSQHRVLKGLDLDIADGEFISFLGPSGCGKSTLLYCIAGLEEISTGSILFDGRDISGLAPRDRNIALVFQDYALYPHMAVRDNMAFPLRQQRVGADAIKRQVAWAAELLGLEELLDRSPAELSGGQRQRVAVGRAIVRNPAALLMDEPLSNLDASLRVRMRTEIKRLQRELAVTTIFVTHDQEEAMVLSDRIAVMHDGVLQQFADPMAVYREPANQFVAGFIGSPQMNFLPGSAVSGGQDDSRVVGIRPHDLTPSAGREDGALSLTGELALIEPAGPIHFLDVLIGDRMVKATCGDPGGLRPGASLTLTAADRSIHLFDRASGARV